MWTPRYYGARRRSRTSAALRLQDRAPLGRWTGPARGSDDQARPALVLIAGAIGDRFGRRPALLTGLIGFALASGIGALVSGPGRWWWCGW
ncbi:MAG TPA: hypothetical protein VKB37_22690 [Jatrophihabitantaceae bacterium]|nr:hypothetical protein [Jatrophihabitantaceae bacterium]